LKLLTAFRAQIRATLRTLPMLPLARASARQAGRIFHASQGLYFLVELENNVLKLLSSFALHPQITWRQTLIFNTRRRWNHQQASFVSNADALC